MSAAPSTIGGVIAELTSIIDSAKAADSRIGYFPALYRNVTIKVRDGIANGLFEDGPRMERLDVVFAGRYLAAYNGWRDGKPISSSWRIAFEAAAYWTPAILQHLLLGINAHINLDLGIATAETAPGAALPAIHNDFNKITDLLSAMTLSVEKEVGSVSPWIGLLARIDSRTPEVLANFDIRIARDLAWMTAEQLAARPSSDWPSPIGELDTRTTLFGNLVRYPGPILRAGFLAIRLRETASPRKVIDVLCSVA